jgi:hypothetical protein
MPNLFRAVVVAKQVIRESLDPGHNAFMRRCQVAENETA